MSIASYLEEVIDDRIKETQNHQEVHFNCPICGDSRHRMYVNLNEHSVYCHNCEYSHTFIQLIMDIEGINYKRASERYHDVKGSMYIPENVLLELRNNLIFGNTTSFTLSKRSISLPEDYIPLNFESRNPMMKNAIKYLMLKRRITIRQMKSHDFGICLSGEYKNRIIIPIKESNEVKFFVARAVGNTKGGLKEKSPSTEDYQLSKSQVVFNIDNASILYNSFILTEGIFDALSFDDFGISALGKRVSEDQLAVILGYREHLTNGVYVALDWDARTKGVELAKELYKYLPVKVINLPKGDLEKGHDPNSYLKTYGKKALFELIDSAEEYSFSYGLKRKFFS